MPPRSALPAGPGSEGGGGEGARPTAVRGLHETRVDRAREPAVKALVILLLMLTAPARAAAERPRVHVLELADSIQPASLRYVERGLREAAEAEAALVVIELDTPGGLLDSTRAMTSAILASPVPVVVHVTPSGARAASAGFFVLLAADVAAMAPGTNTGAAAPVTIGAGGAEQDDADMSLTKVSQDAAALARSLAERRGRSVTAATEAIEQATAFTAEEARARGLIEVVAADRAALLADLDGRSITRFDGTRRTLRLGGAEIVPVERTFAERVLSVIADPQIAYLLLLAGVLGLLIELTTPGFLVPGTAGALALLVGLYGMSVLPVNVSGALLVLAGLGLIVAEVFVTSYGLLAVAGIASLVVGSLILVDTPVPAFQLGPEVVAPVAVVLAALVAFLAVRAARSRGGRPQSGLEAMIGERGRAVTAIDPAHDGKVFVHGEYWAASAPHAVPEGATVRVEAADGHRIRVSLVPAHQGGSS